MALLEYVFLERLCEECEEIARLQFILTNVALRPTQRFRPADSAANR